MPAGRPTEYNEKVLKKAKKYLELCQDEEIQVIKLANDQKGYQSYENKLKVKLPSIEGLARYLSVNRSTIYEWKEKHEEFSDILEEILSEQAQRLINNGLSGDYNPTISKLILTKHGYSDKQEITGADGKDLIPTPILGDLNVPINNGNQENSEAIEADPSSAGRDESIEDNLDTTATDSGSPERHDTDADLNS